MSWARAPERTPPRGSAAAQSESAGPALGLPIDKADTMLPADLLQGGEIIILILKPSAWYILLGALGHYTAIAGLIAGGWAAAAQGLIGDVTRREVLLTGMILLLLRGLWQFLLWLSRIYVLTDRRVIRRRGVFTVLTFEATLTQIQHTQVSRLIRERLFGLGTISFSTAGTGVPEAFWEMVNRPHRVHRRIVEAIRRYRHE